MFCYMLKDLTLVSEPGGPSFLISWAHFISCVFGLFLKAKVGMRKLDPCFLI